MSGPALSYSKACSKLDRQFKRTNVVESGIDVSLNAEGPAIIRNSMRFEILTIFPNFFTSIFENGILRRALAEGLVEVGVHDLRTFTHDRHRTVDDRPFGGGEGMVLKPQPIADALASLEIAPKDVDVRRGTTSVVPLTALDEDGALAPAEPRPTVILMSAQGRPFTQSLAREIASLSRVVLICGRYEGVDERINQLYCDMELSIGDYVLSGGELAAAVVIDAAMRLLPGVLGNEASSEFESFGIPDAEISTEVEGVPRSQHGAGGLLDYPHYTRPADFGGLKVPEPLLNGDHQAIRRWRREQQLRKTLTNRPDLLDQAKRSGALSRKDLEFLELLR
jgi:tRNA (guanine37-N1)-methyltransferase